MPCLFCIDFVSWIHHSSEVHNNAECHSGWLLAHTSDLFVIWPGEVGAKLVFKVPYRSNMAFSFDLFYGVVEQNTFWNALFIAITVCHTIVEGEILV